MLAKMYAIKPGFVKKGPGIMLFSVILLGGMFSSANAIGLDEIAAKSGVLLIGNGVGSVECKNGKKYDNIEIFILVADNSENSSSRNPSGAGLSSSDNKRLAIEITEYNKEKGHSEFEINGIVLFDEICDSGSTTTSVIKGACDDKKSLFFETSNGGHGEFKANIQCNASKF